MSEKIRVAHIIKSLGRGGAETLIRDGVAVGADRFDFVVGYFLPWKDALVSELESCGAGVHCFDVRSEAGMLARVPRVVAWLRKERVDVIHAHLPTSGVVARLAGMICGLPVVYTEHNLQERYRIPTRLANRLTWGLQSHVIAVSQPVAESIAGKKLATRVPVEVIHNGVDVARFSPDASVRPRVREQLDIPESATVIGTVAVLRSQKRLDLWLNAARQISESNPETRFLIVGDGPLRDELTREADRLGITDKVRFAGLQSDPLPYYRTMDIYMMSSDFEGLPLALLEAMSCRCAIATTVAGGIPEAVTDGDNGLLVPIGDVDGLVAAVRSLVDDENRRQALASNARRRVEERFSIERMLSQVEACYRTVHAGAKPTQHPEEAAVGDKRVTIR